MNNIYKVLIAFAVGLLAGWLLFGGSVLGGVTNYDSLQLQPSSSSDNALDVRNSGGTSRFVVSGSGVITLSGATTLSGTLTATSDVRLKSSIETGVISTVVGGGAGVITNAQACDGSLVNSTASTTAASTLTLPVAENMFGDCLTTSGDSVTFFIRELSASTTVITAGSASTTIAIDNGGTVTLGAVGSAKITLTRFSDTLMWAFVSVYKP